MSDCPGTVFASTHAVPTPAVFAKSVIAIGLATLAGCVGTVGGDDVLVDASAPDDASDNTESPIRVDFLTTDASGARILETSSAVFPDLSVDRVVFQLHDVGIVGDNAPGGDPDATVSSLVLDFPEPADQTVSFPNAPPGRYSLLSMLVDRTYATEPIPPAFEGQRLSVFATGTFMQGDDVVTFILLDDVSVEARSQVSFTQLPGVQAAVIVKIDVESWLAPIPAGVSDADDGVATIGMGAEDALAEELRGRLANIFSTDVPE